MHLNNIKHNNSFGLQAGIFGLLLIVTFIVLSLYLPSYIDNNPPICKQEATVKEIIAISGTEAKVRLSNGEVWTHVIENYNNEKKFNNHLKVNESICLEYKNLFHYYLSDLFLNLKAN